MIIAPDQTLNVVKAMSPTPGTSPPAVQTVQAAPEERRAPAGNPGGMKIGHRHRAHHQRLRKLRRLLDPAELRGQPAGPQRQLSSASRPIRNRARKSPSKARWIATPRRRIGGEINLLSAALFTDMKVSFQGVDMTSVTPYSGRFAGYKIEKGKLSIDVAYHVEDRKLDAKQRFVVDQLQLGERVESPDAVRLPLRLAVALLKDRNGVIDLDLPVTGSLDDPQFRIGPIIWKAFVGLAHQDRHRAVRAARQPVRRRRGDEPHRLPARRRNPRRRRGRSARPRS